GVCVSGPGVAIGHNAGIRASGIQKFILIQDSTGVVDINAEVLNASSDSYAGAFSDIRLNQANIVLIWRRVAGGPPAIIFFAHIDSVLALGDVIGFKGTDAAGCRQVPKHRKPVNVGRDVVDHIDAELHAAAILNLEGLRS